ncbi:hypothetical protein PFISCL1PPCAC_3787, partial [Pristionchus fissidentatus]
NSTRDPVDLHKCRKIGEGWTKVVYDCDGIAVKIPNLIGQNMRDCLEHQLGISLKFRSTLCKRHLIEALITDTITLTSFDGDPAVPELLGYHFPADNFISEKFQVFTRLGVPISTISLL